MSTDHASASPVHAADRRHNGERLYHRIAAVVTLALLCILLWDDVANSERLFVPLLVLLVAHLVVQVTVLIWLRPETEARITLEIGHLVEVDAPTPPKDVPASPPAPATPAPYRYNGYTLYRTETTDKGGNPRTFYFFSKRIPKGGAPAPKPEGHFVGVHRITGLPFLKRGTGTDGTMLGDTAHPRPEQCQALTVAGDQCKNNGRPKSKYCGRHHGYRPPSRAVALSAKDTKPRSRRAVDTAPSARAA